MNRESQPSRHAGGGGNTNVCPRCGEHFTCGMAAGLGECWCGSLPPVAIDPAVTGCLCPACLAGLAERSRAGPA
ncbi:MAG: cysteine-rich CWC family protein [Rhodocyclaceae bacterium]|nr:cysteine-rich CWC family protein [Rhodocyclaceae bacterium]